MCPALIRRRESSPPSGAQLRDRAPSWCRHDAADRVGKAASDGFALVETGETATFGKQQSTGDVLHARFFEATILCSKCSQKKKRQKVVTLQLH